MAHPTAFRAAAAKLYDECGSSAEVAGALGCSASRARRLIRRRALSDSLAPLPQRRADTRELREPKPELELEGLVDQFLAPAPRPGQVPILDNPSAHKSAEAQRLAEAAGARAMRPPPYSPDVIRPDRAGDPEGEGGAAQVGGPDGGDADRRRVRPPRPPRGIAYARAGLPYTLGKTALTSR